MVTPRCKTSTSWHFSTSSTQVTPATPQTPMALHCPAHSTAPTPLNRLISSPLQAIPRRLAIRPAPQTPMIRTTTMAKLPQRSARPQGKPQKDPAPRRVRHFHPDSISRVDADCYGASSVKPATASTSNRRKSTGNAVSHSRDFPYLLGADLSTTGQGREQTTQAQGAKPCRPAGLPRAQREARSRCTFFVPYLIFHCSHHCNHSFSWRTRLRRWKLRMRKRSMRTRTCGTSCPGFRQRM